MRIALCAALVLGLTATTSFSLGRGPGAPPASETKGAESSLELIAKALDAGEIDQDTATLYRVYSVVDDAKLPGRYRGGVAMRDGTSVLRDARSRYDDLRPETREALRPYLFPRGGR